MFASMLQTEREYISFLPAENSYSEFGRIMSVSLHISVIQQQRYNIANGLTKEGA